MSDIKFRHFVAEGPEATALMDEVRAKQAACFEQRKAIAAKYGADDVATRRGFGGTRIVGFIFNDGGEHLGFKQQESNLDNFYVPDRRRKIGKQAAEEIERFKCFDANSFLVEHFKAYRMVSGPPYRGGSSTVYASRAGFDRAQRVIVLEVPERPKKTSDGAEVIYDSGGAYAAHPMLREIKKSQFVALTEEGDESEDQAA